jgi:glycosyltransferase involved in cell wall biosynthesis
MRIGIDARELGERPTGVGRYLSGLLREWSAMNVSHELVLYAASELALDTHGLRQRIVPGARGTWWEQMQLPKSIADDRLDVFFAPAYTAPLRLPVPTVLTIHDVSYLAHPEWFRLREGIRRRWLTRHSAARAQAIITVSHFSKGEIVEHLRVPDSRVHVIPQGIDRPPAIATTRDEARVLFVGSLLNRRHVPELVQAIDELAETTSGVTLDLVGDDRSFPHEDIEGLINRLGLERRVRWHRYVTDAQLQELYDRARAFAFLSEYEGLGMTPLEALASGVPPVLYDTPVARESCGEAALYVAAGNRPALLAALERVLFDEGTRIAILSAAAATLARYDWARAAGETLEVIERAGR